MLFQMNSQLMFLIWLVLATVVVFLVMYLAVKVIESEHKASDKKLWILLIAFLAVLVIPIILGVVGMILGAIGYLLASARNLLDGGGANYLPQLGTEADPFILGMTLCGKFDTILNK